MTSVSAATVVIATRNRRDELRRALASCVVQTVSPTVLVLDDASDDGTCDMVRAEFPQVRIERSEQRLGLIAQRNRAATLTDADVIVSIDDDAVLTTPRVVEQVLKEFADDGRIGAVAIPFVNVNTSPDVLQLAPSLSGVYVCAHYIGTAHAVRRKVFETVGGYRAGLIHDGEEKDFCLRMLDAGYVCSLGRSDPIHHFESPKRDWARVAFYARRNDVLFALHNVPFPQFVVHLVGTTMSGLRFIWRRRANGTVFAGLKGILAGYAGIFSNWRARAPVKRATYLLHRRIKGVGSLPLREFESELNRL